MLTGERVTIRAVAPADTAVLTAVAAEPGVARWWGPVPEDELADMLAIVHDDVVIGAIQYAEETDPMYRHASIDVFVGAAYQGRGLGADAVAALAGWLLGPRGHHRVTIDPAADNEAAIRCYARVGFRPVGVLRRYERDPWTSAWHDGLLMDLLVGELT